MMKINRLAKYIWDYGPSSLSFRKGDNGNFHKQKLISAGHWIYLGHDVVKLSVLDDADWDGWTIPSHPMRKLFYYKTKKLCCQDLFEEYMTMLWTAITIEEENEKRKNPR